MKWMAAAVLALICAPALAAPHDAEGTLRCFAESTIELMRGNDGRLDTGYLDSIYKECKPGQTVVFETRKFGIIALSCDFNKAIAVLGDKTVCVLSPVTYK